MKRIMARSWRGLIVALATVLWTDVVHASCRPLIEALEKADRQPRLAQYDIDSRDQPLTGVPFLVRIHKVVWAGGERTETSGVNPVLASLRRAEQAGTAQCDAPTSDSFRGAAVAKIRFTNPMASKSMNPMTMWIGKASGLPVYHEINGLGPGGYAWVYGDAVKEPPKP